MKEKIKNAMKHLGISYIIAFVSGFMFLIYEPINMYATNVDDFWFDLYIMLKPSLLFFILFVFLLIMFYTIVYLINNHFSKKLYVYKTIVVLSLIVLFILYIQGNFLISGLPSLDGAEIDWTQFPTQMTISAVLCIVVTIVFAGATLIFKYDKVKKVYIFLTLTVFGMLAITLITTLFTRDALEKKNKIILSTTQNINNYSENKNFFIFLVDAVDSVQFEEVLNNSSEYKDTFEDFTYYPDTMCTYAFTRESIPYILSGVWNENETSYTKYYNNALDSSPLFHKLNELGYDINIYDYELFWAGKESDKVQNGIEIERRMNNIKYIKQLGKYIMFKYLPYQLKKYSSIETMNFELCKINNEYDPMQWPNTWYYDMMNNTQLVKQANNYFSFTHIAGGHVPYEYDKDFNPIENGTYTDQLENTLTLLNRYLNRLKESGAYDNSVIMIMSDHGLNSIYFEGRQNPILYIKGINEHHDMRISDKPVSYTDLNEIYMDLLDGKSSEELLANVDYNRKRRYMFYIYTKEDHMEEYEQTGKAWDEETLIPTGRVYDYKK